MNKISKKSFLFTEKTYKIQNFKESFNTFGFRKQNCTGKATDDAVLQPFIKIHFEKHETLESGPRYLLLIRTTKELFTTNIKIFAKVEHDVTNASILEKLLSLLHAKTKFASMYHSIKQSKYH